jgi:hypothetical protein
VNDFRVGGLVRNKKFGWIGKVAAIECAACGEAAVDGNLVCRHKGFANLAMCLTVDQGGFLKPWCLPDRFEPTAVGPSVWDLLRNNPLDEFYRSS